ncbi:MAG: monovalent cation/H+ antiporter complex subunit F [Phycisphaerales bacterium JB063]
MTPTLAPILIAAADTSHAAAEAAPPSAAQPWLMLLVQIGVGVLVLSILLCLWRMIRGPHLADRVLAGDTMAMLVAGLVIVLAIKLDSALFYDAAIVVAILGFASTVAFAQYIGAKHKTSDRDTPRGDAIHNQPGLLRPTAGPGLNRGGDD